MTTPRPDYPGLDTLRAVAAIAVVATHTSFWTGQYGKGLWGAATARLDIGVAFFFVLSGFLLSRPFLAAMADRRPLPPAGRYFWKRALRIVPLYVIVVVVALVVLQDNRGAGVGTWVANLTMTDLYVTGLLPAGLTQMWSLATEVAFYLILPGLMVVFSRTACRSGWSAGRLMIGLAVLTSVTVAWLVWIAPLRVGAGQWLPAHLSWFAVGIALAVISVDVAVRGRGWERLTVLAHQPGTCWIMAGALFAIAATPIGGPILLVAPSAGAAVAKNLIYAVVAGLIVLPSVLGPSRGTRYADVLALKPLRHIGHISYGIFCIHLLVIHAVVHVLDYPLFTGNGLLVLALTLAVTIVLSEIAYRLVERPAMRLKDVRFTGVRLRNVRKGAAKTSAAVADSAASTHH
ncbi:MAG: acyltransferase [Aeromicrobium sp.]